MKVFFIINTQWQIGLFNQYNQQYVSTHFFNYNAYAF